MIERRLKHPEWPSDLIVIDGGRPQVLAVARVLRDNNIKTPILGISKRQNDKLVFLLTAKNFSRIGGKRQKYFVKGATKPTASPNPPEKEEKRQIWM